MTGWAPITSLVLDKGFGGSRGGDPINGIVIHHVAGTNGRDYVANANSRNSHPTYHIARDGTVTGIVHPDRRPFSTGGRPDSEAITVEIDNASVGGEWPITDASMESLIQITIWHASQSPRKGRGFALNIKGQVQSEFFIAWHQQYVATACPGPYIINRLGWIRDECIRRTTAAPPPPPPPPVLPPGVEVTPGALVGVNAAFPVYSSATKALNSETPTATYLPGNYYVYKVAGLVVNLSRTSGAPGGWAVASNLGLVVPTPPPVEPEPPAEEPIDPPIEEPQEPPVTEPEPPIQPTPQPSPVTPEQEQAAAQLGYDLIHGNLDTGNEVIAKIRTFTPLVAGPVVAWFVTNFPEFAEFLDAQAEGWQLVVYGAISAAAGYGYWSLAKFLGSRTWFGRDWSIIERIMLGSSSRPVYVASATPAAAASKQIEKSARKGLR